MPANLDLKSARFEARTYLEGELHPVLPFSRTCKECPLSTGCSVGGTGPDDLSKVKLIVISDHPGYYETLKGYSQVPVYLVKEDGKRKSRLPERRNSGQFLRDLISDCFGLCHWSEVYYTNALKCDPLHKGRKINVSEKQHLGICAGNWLRWELETLNQYAPTAPILVGGSIALKALQMLYPGLPNGKLNDLRRREDLHAGEHPVVVTFNPAAPARSEARLETEVGMKYKKPVLEVKNLQWWFPVLPGSPVWVFLKDIEPLAKLL
ncbi:uracil-DNA glycosylase family protein [Leptolyngbya sp. AN03gr2]|uniref:uracil-DNA glycosylase family protein n=1 Tax=Leptolyngbya sp. AN03gr2 TaxID=3423364 RepID=UPI003D311BEC